MSGKGFSLDDYVDVAERIHQFYERYPDGRLTTGSPPLVHEVGGKPYIWYHARAYRTPDDPHPGDGWAAEPVPGATPYTRDSELMNAETAAWGRAIVALGFETKKIASKQEARARSESTPAQEPGLISEKQRKLIFAKSKGKGMEEADLKALLTEAVGTPSTREIPASQMDKVLKRIDAWTKPNENGEAPMFAAPVPAGTDPDADDIPF